VARAAPSAMPGTASRAFQAFITVTSVLRNPSLQRRLVASTMRRFNSRALTKPTRYWQKIFLDYVVPHYVEYDDLEY
jgi:hypothetical protein